MSDDKLIRLSDAITALRSADLPFGYGHAAEVIRAIPAVQVVVKPLEWVETRKGQYFEARAISIFYSVRLGSDGVVRWQAGCLGTWHEVNSIKAAKAEAQADYEGRIRSALITQPSPDVAAILGSADDIPELPEAYQPRNIAKALTAYCAVLARVKGGEA